MRKQLFYTLALCGALSALGAQAQTSPGSASDPSTSPGSVPGSTPGSSSYSGSSESRSGLSGHQFSPTGRMSHEAVRGSQLTGAQVTSSSGGEVGTISDTIINPASGRLEFAVISVSGNTAGSSSSGSASSTTSSTGISSSTPSSVAGGKQVAVPWMLLRSSAAAGSSATSTTSAGSQTPSFVFSGDTSKLQSAPNFDATTDLNQPSWRQSVFSYFGLSGRSSATGAAETPGSSSTSSGSSIPNK